MSMEKWDLYTCDRRLTGLEHTRGERIPQGLFHLVVHVWIRNAKGQFLISQRSANRKKLPLMWECVGGSALKGEDSLSAALREVAEEVGIELCPERGRMISSVAGRVVDGRKFSDIVDVWLFDYEGDFDLSRATTDEVAQARWMNTDEIRQLLQSGKMVQTLGYFLEDPVFVA